MALTSGTRLGPYEIVSSIGQGGMGEVYKARDTRLDRAVAVKVLPSDFAADADRRQRFEREARAVAALEHPHICPLYDVGQHDGVHYLVMQHLDGETLAARLGRSNGPLPIDQTLQIGIAIARALDRAHRAGITHRDLKPANIMLTKSGPKLLDFGLAKLRTAVTPLSLSAMTELTAPQPSTAHGLILGTVPYMAPEQVEGRDTDERSDVWALGAVVYETATGARPFAGDTPASVIGAILKDTPPAVSTRQPLAPRLLDHVVARCLAKDPDERWQSIGDVGRMLETIAADHTTPADRPVRARGRWAERLAWIATTALLLIALAWAAPWNRPVAPPREVVRLSLTTPPGTTFAAHFSATVPTPQFAVSPDGRSIAFVAGPPAAKPTLWLRPLDDVESRSLPGTEDAQDPFWSPDSRWIGFFDPQGTLKRVPVSGGTVQTITRGLTDPRGASWSQDDTILFGTGYGGVHKVPASAGTPQVVTKLDSTRSEGSHRWPAFLPDGRHFLFTVRSGLADQRGVYLGSLDGTIKRRLIQWDGDAQYVAPGYVLFLDGDTLLGQAFDHNRLEPSGQPVPIAASVGRSSRGSGAVSASSAGTLAYADATLRPGALTWVDRGGRPLGTVGPGGEHDYADFRLSLDEKRLAASLVNPKLSIPDIWLVDLVRGGTSPLTFGPGINAAAVWSPQADRIAFRTNRKGLTELFQKSTLEGGTDEPLLVEETARNAGVGSSNLIPSDWSSDGKFLAFATGAPSDLWLLTIAEPTRPVRIVQSPGDQMHANFSPDGRYIAYTSNESGRFDVFVETLARPGRKFPISTNGGYEPRWRADGREIYYLADDRMLMVVPVSSGAAPFGVPRPLFEARVHAGVSMLRTHYVPSRDGSRFLLHARSSDLPPATITVVLNWMAALKR